MYYICIRNACVRDNSRLNSPKRARHLPKCCSKFGLHWQVFSGSWHTANLSVCWHWLESSHDLFSATLLGRQRRLSSLGMWSAVQKHISHLMSHTECGGMQRWSSVHGPPTMLLNFLSFGLQGTRCPSSGAVHTQCSSRHLPRSYWVHWASVTQLSSSKSSADDAVRRKAKVKIIIIANCIANLISVFTIQNMAPLTVIKITCRSIYRLGTCSTDVAALILTAFQHGAYRIQLSIYRHST